MFDKRIQDLELIKQVFDKYGVRIVLTYGALLGWYRDKNFLPADDDIDLAVIDPIDYKTRKAIGWTLYDLGFKPQDMGFMIFDRLEPQEMGYNGTAETGIIVCEKNFKFTIFFFGQPEPCDMHGEDIVCIPKYGAYKLISSPAKFYKKLGEIKVGGKKYLCPAPIEDYLAYSYFNNWKDKTDRRHSDTYWVSHNKEPIVEDVAKKNEVVFNKNKHV